MPSDAFIGILSGLGEAHRSRQKNIFDQEVERRSKYEKLLQTAATDPENRPEARTKLTELYANLTQTPYEKKLPKDFERQVVDALTSVNVQMEPEAGPPLDVTPPQTSSQPLVLDNKRVTLAKPSDSPVQMPSRFSPQEMSQRKIADAVQMLQALGPIQQQQALDTERAKLAMQPEEFRSAGPEATIYGSKSGNVVKEGERPARLPQFRDVVDKGRVIRKYYQEDPSKVIFQEDIGPEQKPSTTGPGSGNEPLYPVFQNGQVIYMPRSQAAGQAAPRTVYGETGAGATGGVPGATMTPPPAISDMTQSNIAGWRLAIDLLDKDVLPNLGKLQASFGPVVGRLRNVQIRNLGGWGTSTAEKEIAINLRRLLMSQAFAEGGKQLTETEKEEFTALNPALEDTVEQAIVKAKLSRDYLQRRLNFRLDTMPERQRQQMKGGTPPSGERVIDFNSLPTAAPTRPPG